MIVSHRDLRGYIATTIVVVLLVAFLMTMIWLSLSRRHIHTAGFQPGWHCDNLGGEGADVCVRERRLGAPPAQHRRPEARRWSEPVS